MVFKYKRVIRSGYQASKSVSNRDRNQQIKTAREPPAALTQYNLYTMWYAKGRTMETFTEC